MQAHSLAVPVLQNPSSFLIAQIGPHFILIPSELDLFHWKESIPSTWAFSLCQRMFIAYHIITDLATRRKTGKTVHFRPAPTEIQIIHSLFLVFRPSASLRLQAFQVSNSNNCRRIHDSVSCILWAMKLQNAQDPQCGLNKAEGGQRETNINKPQTSPAMKLENTNKLKGWNNEWTGGWNLRTKALQGDHISKEFKTHPSPVVLMWPSDG